MNGALMMTTMIHLLNKDNIWEYGSFFLVFFLIIKIIFFIFF
jgi:hypothetical protein